MRSVKHMSCNALRATAAFLSACMLIGILLSIPVNAAGELGESEVRDIIVGVDPYYVDEYRYCFDVLYGDMVFNYRFTTIAYDEQTHEQVIEEGSWWVGKSSCDQVSLTVVNHADTPILLDARVNAPELDACGVSVISEGFAQEKLDACRIDEAGKVLVSQSDLRLRVAGTPVYERYQGDKPLGVTVCVIPVSGIATNGHTFISPFYRGE